MVKHSVVQLNHFYLNLYSLKSYDLKNDMYWFEREREMLICFSTYFCIYWLLLVCVLTWNWTHSLVCGDDYPTHWATQPCHIFCLLILFIYFWGWKRGEREIGRGTTPTNVLLHLFLHLLVSSSIYVHWLGMEPTTLVYGVNTWSNWTTCPGQNCDF